ncbi:MAG: hypothetical protein K5873_03975 [Treponema sp.]|nr:hypothetical protein [Treponema sp.]
MKITKFTGAALALTAALALIFTGCSNDDDSSSTSGPVSAADLENDLEIAALNVLRGLCQLPTDEDATNSAEEKGNGVEYLPENWQNSTFTCDQGYVLGDDSTVVSMAASSSDDAAEFVSGLVGESIDSDSYTWNMDGLGSLKFNKVNNDENLYATLDVSIDQIPGLSRIDFVPWNVIEEKNPTNSFYGKPYFTEGDIIKRKKDETVWMCVRPAGGEWHHKDKSYWVCIQPKKSNGSYLFSETTKNVNDSQWTYAKSLIDFRIAKEAAHTMLLFASNERFIIKNKGDIKINLKNLMKNASNCWDIAFAYGSPKKDSNRKGHADSLYTQPILIAVCTKQNSSIIKMNMYTKYSEDLATDMKVFEGDQKQFAKFDSLKKELLSATDYYDLSFMANMGIKESGFTYSYYDCCHKWDKDNGIAFEKPDRCTHMPTGCNIIFTPQLMIKDNKGKKDGDAVKPVADSTYEIIWRQGDFSVESDINDDTSSYVELYKLDYWRTLKQTERTVDGVQVALVKETK